MNRPFMLSVATAIMVVVSVPMTAVTWAQGLGTTTSALGAGKETVLVSMDFVDAPRSVIEAAMKSFPSGRLPASDAGAARAALLACGATDVQGPRVNTPDDYSGRTWQTARVLPPPKAGGPPLEIDNVLDVSPHINPNGTITVAYKFLRRGYESDPPTAPMSDDQFFRRLPTVYTFADGKPQDVSFFSPISASMHHYAYITVKIVLTPQTKQP